MDFIWFGVFKTRKIPYASIQEVAAVGRWRLAPFRCVDFQNRLFFKTFLVKLKRGFYEKNLLLTPENLQAFGALLTSHGVSINTDPGSNWPIV
ncbi:hypothetical protein M2282_006193 [Variovorax boronicumulans]|uniref:hypothetical protein n=1 Tax=Variovorax boronicumulans TaxID=436515 RepID=UPI0024747A9A|nr:hypothetical protein [Variovorax boronicumulans]MDH6171012.1 hypothetical protein [Variovorax boronicumulans]